MKHFTALVDHVTHHMEPHEENKPKQRPHRSWFNQSTTRETFGNSQTQKDENNDVYCQISQRTEFGI